MTTTAQQSSQSLVEVNRHTVWSTVHWRKVGDAANRQSLNCLNTLKSLALPRGLNPCFRRERARFGALEVFRRSEPLRRGADRGFVLSHWPSSPDRTCDAPAGVVECGHAVAIGARRAGDAPGGVIECRCTLRIGAGLAGDAPDGVAEGRGLCRGGARQYQREGEREGDPGHLVGSSLRVLRLVMISVRSEAGSMAANSCGGGPSLVALVTLSHRSCRTATSVWT